MAQSMGENIWICGGAEIYKHAMPMSEELYLTQIDQDYEGDVKFYGKTILRPKSAENGHNRRGYTQLDSWALGSF